ncbi:helix-turn-helix domain-containing protein [Nocardia sp. NPDC006630]|uniref:TetR/AcrR family transcriptional regulator n=1 Tax=Nocardia sp. NPDC006630 TaxID=3157181 RepID=UPI0033BB4047
MSRQAARSETTRTSLINAARELFAARGYAAVGTPEIVEHAGSSRGALYHHFKDKQELFRAVYEQIQQQLMQQIADELARTETTDPLTAFEAALRMFLQSCMEPERTRICLIDGPAVLGWQEWRALDEKYALGMVAASLQLGVDSGALRNDVPLRPLAHMIIAALGEAGLLIASSDDPAAARIESEAAVLAILDGLRT